MPNCRLQVHRVGKASQCRAALLPLAMWRFQTEHAAVLVLHDETPRPSDPRASRDMCHAGNSAIRKRAKCTTGQDRTRALSRPRVADGHAVEQSLDRTI